MQTDAGLVMFLTRVEQIVKSEVKVLLTSQRNIEGRQANLEMLLQQWIDAGSHGRFHGEYRSGNTNIEERTELSQPVGSVSVGETASYGEYHSSTLPLDAQIARSGQDQREVLGCNSLQSIDQAGSSEAPQSSTLFSLQRKFSDAVSGRYPIDFMPHVRESEIRQQLRDKTRGDVPRSFLDRIAFSWVFDVVFGVLIVLNSLSIGVEIEHRTTQASPATFFTIVATTFAILFFVELVIRIAAHGLIIYFCGPDKLWNVFDVAMVVVSAIEVLDTLLSAQGRSTASWRLLRMVRLLRIARVLRFVPQLRIILIMILESIKSLGWLLCILITILYIFSIIFTMGAIEYLGVPGDPDFTRKRYSTEIATHYGTLMRSLYTMFTAITSGQSWGEMMDPLTDVGTIFVAVFLFYIAFAVLALLNIVASVFVERALTKSQCDRDLLVEKQIQSKQACIQHLKLIFEEGDADRSGNMTFQEFEMYMKDERFVAYLSHLAVDTQNIAELFEQLDRDRNGYISVQEFVDNLLHLTRGQTVEQVVQRLMNENRDLKHHIFKLKDFVQVEFTNIKLWIEQPNYVSAVPDNVETATMIECDSPCSSGHFYEAI